MEKELRSKAKELLESGQVSVVIGYGPGSTAFKSTPLFATTPAHADALVWNPTCVNNLSVYLPQAAARRKVGVVVKPCDVKNVVELIKENQVERGNLVTIVMSCPGVLDLDSLKDIDARDIKSVEWAKDGIKIATGSGDVTIPKEKALLPKCLTCTIAEPSMADVKIGDFSAHVPVVNPRASIEEYETLSPVERRAFWAKQFEKCIRCYACRQACPGCYCKECFVDKNGQIWASKSTDATANWFFHMTRMMHIAGRCTGCGECERACPMGIPLSLMGKSMAADVQEMFGTVAGTNAEGAPVMGCFEMSDPDPCPE